MRGITNNLLAVLLIGAAACGGQGATNPDLINGTMSAVIDGQAWQANFLLSGSRTASGNGYIVGINGVSNDQISIGLVIDQAAVGPFLIGPGGLGSASVATRAGGANVFLANAVFGSGSIQVSASDASHIAGTFTFTAPPGPNNGDTHTMLVTQGHFDVTF